MRNLLLFAILLFSFGCGGGSSEPDTTTTTTTKKKPVASMVKVPASQRITLENKGVGPIKNVNLDSEIDQEMAAKGKEVYNTMCTACHKPYKKFIGPAPKGLLKRRSPEWIMNMILNPEKMVKEDPTAKDLLAEFNGSPMANQGLTEEQARQVLEYIRTL